MVVTMNKWRLRLRWWWSWWYLSDGGDDEYMKIAIKVAMILMIADGGDDE